MILKTQKGWQNFRVYSGQGKPGKAGKRVTFPNQGKPCKSG